MSPLLETTDPHETDGLEKARVLILTDECQPLFPVIEVLRAQKIWIETYDLQHQRISSRFAAPFDLMVLFPRAAEISSISRLRQAHPEIFLALIVPNHDAFDPNRWLTAGVDGLWPLDDPHELTGIRLAAIAQYARRVRTVNHHSKLVGSLTLDHQTRTALLNGCRLDLTSYEFSLLSTFAENLGNVLSRQELLELAKGSAEEAFDRSIDVQISRLRAKLGDDPRRPTLLKTVRGRGYVLVPGTLASKP